MTDSTIVTVSRDQVSAARALVAMSGGPDKVEPLIAKIASAVPRSKQAREERAS